MQRTTRSGYTLMELIVVLALLAIATAILTPPIGRTFGSLQLRMAAATVKNICAQARTHAVYEGHNYRVIVSSREEPQRTLYLVRDDGKTMQHVMLAPSIRVFASSSANEWSDEVAPLYFFSDGTSQLATLELRGAREQRVQLTLDPLTARARISQLYRAGEEAQ